MPIRQPLLVLALASLPLRLAAQPDPGPHAERAPDRVELATPEVAVPLRMEKGRPVVDVTVDGKGPFPFVLDTGAGGTVLESELAKELGLPEAGEVRIGDPINPHSIAAKQFRIDRLAIGGAIFSGMVATAMENGGFQQHLGARGILGMPLFAELLLTLDYGRGELRIGRGELPAPDGRELVALSRGFGGTIRVPITVASLSIEADLDSGSAGGVSLPEKIHGRASAGGKARRSRPCAHGQLAVRRPWRNTQGDGEDRRAQPGEPGPALQPAPRGQHRQRSDAALRPDDRPEGRAHPVRGSDGRRGIDRPTTGDIMGG